MQEWGLGFRLGLRLSGDNGNMETTGYIIGL